MSLHSFYPIFDDVAWLRRMLPLSVKLVQPQTILQAEIKEALNKSILDSFRASIS